MIAGWPVVAGAASSRCRWSPGSLQKIENFNDTAAPLATRRHPWPWYWYPADIVLTCNTELQVSAKAGGVDLDNCHKPI